MKLVLLVVAIILTVASCTNAGDENVKNLNSVKTDSSVNNGNTDTIQNPGPHGEGARPTLNPDSLSNAGSNFQKNQNIKDTNKTKQ